MLLFLVCFFALASATTTLSKRNVTGTSWVYLGEDTGPPEHRASGILYGIPENETQIPDHFFTDMGFWNSRAGGAQLPAPLRGWTWGYDEFLGRYNSTVHNYRTTRRFGGNFQVLIHDLWGIDSYNSADDTPAPGDNGDWTSYDDFLTILFQLFIADDVTDGVYFDIWNEPDNGLYLNRGLDRYLDVWGHTYHRIKNEFPNPQTVGPSFGHLPDFGAFDWFEAWANFTATNNSVPTWISMHFLYDSGDLNRSIEAFQNFLQPAGISYNGPFVLNEYGAIDQQVPSTTAWCISQIERYNAIGLRANWRGEYELHDYMANLLGKPHTYPNYIEDEAIYWPASEYQVYKYYNLNMTGHRVRTAMTEDTLGDTYATVGTDRVRILSGVRPEQGLWAIVLSCLSCVGLPTAGELPIQTFRFNAGGLYQENDGPDDHGYYVHPYTDDALFFYIAQDDPDVAYAFEFSV